MSLFEKLKNKRSSLQEKKDDTTGRGKKPIKVNLKNLVDKAKKNPLNKNLGVKITDDSTNTVKQSEISKQAKKFTKKINKKNINRPEGVIGDTYVSTDKKGNIRSAKKVNPTLKKSISQVKSDIEFKQGIQKVRKLSGQKGTGELSDKAPQKVRKFVKDTRTQKIKDLKLPDTSFSAKDKFSQKGFEKSLKTSTKGPKTGIADPFKGSAITQGQANVKDMQRSAFRKTQPRDIKLPKSFTDFSKKLKKYKTDKAKTTSTSTSTSPRKINKVYYKPTVGVNQAEVSKKQKEFSKLINQNRTSSGTPMRKGATTIPKDTAKDIQISKMKERIKELGSQREKLSSTTGKKDVPTIRKVNKEIRQLTQSMKSNPFAPTVYNKKTAGTTSGAKKVPNTFKTFPTAGGNKVTQSTRSLTAKNKGSVKYNPPSKGVSSPPLSPKGKKFVSRIPGFLKKNKTLARIGKAAVKNPYVAGAVGVGLAAAGAYAGYKAFQNRNKRKPLTYKDFKSLSTPSDPDKGKIIHTRDIPKMNIKKGDVAKFPSPNKIPKSTSAEFKSNYAYK